jgi:glycosyltransferase A (GT-A) superfamily protein (DUF2064 family)
MNKSVLGIMFRIPQYGKVKKRLAAQIGNVLESIQSMPQQGKDLGEKMFNAILRLHKNGYEKIVLLGADSPDLPLSFIELAFSKLDSHELIISPSEDGGYYLVGMKRTIKSLFNDIIWGSGNVLRDTITKAKNKGISCFLLQYWYDIDTLDDLNRWRLNAETNNRHKAAVSHSIDICNSPRPAPKKGRIHRLRVNTKFY